MARSQTLRGGFGPSEYPSVHRRRRRNRGRSRLLGLRLQLLQAPNEKRLSCAVSKQDASHARSTASTHCDAAFVPRKSPLISSPVGLICASGQSVVDGREISPDMEAELLAATAAVLKIAA